MVDSTSVMEGREEAVVISGPRRGQIITVPEARFELTPEEDAMLDAVVDAMKRAAESARALSEEMRGLRDDVRRIQEG